MIKSLSFRKALLAPAMLLLSGIFLQSCTEEMPILHPPSGASSSGIGTTSSKSVINLSINNNANNITNNKPNNILFTSVAGGATLPLLKLYTFAGNNGSQTNNLTFGASFHTDTIGNKKFIFDSSQLLFNKKTYTTFNISGTAKFTVDKLDDVANTASGSFGYYVYDAIINPTDSVYVSGTFNFMK